ncbi:MAG: bifunctional 3'-5' exonuclease/DNA polymerase, partial [Actinocatenispora sp.]
MRWVVHDDPAGALLVEVDATGRRVGPVRTAPSLASEITARESAGSRWVWSETAELYPPVYRSGVRVARCHDLALTEALLLGQAGRWGEPRSLAAAWARLRGLPVPADAPVTA